MNIRSRALPARSRIYRYLYQNHTFCSRQDLANALDISMPTVYQNLTELMQDGLVEFSGEKRSTGGRRASGITVVRDARIAIGIYITRNKLQLVAVDLLLNEIAARTTDCPDAAVYLSQSRSLARPLEQFLHDYRIDRSRILGVSITLPAMLTADGMRLVRCPTMHLNDIPLDGLTEGIPYPVHIENNGTSGGNAEMFFREDSENLAYLFLEDGVGGMIHIAGTPYNGDHNRSGEFGHICVSPGGLRCSCGKNGCLEAYSSSRRISEDLGITPEAFFEALNTGHAQYGMLWTDYLQHLAIGITDIHCMLDCSVVLGGYMIRYLKPWFPLLQEYVSALDPMTSDASYLYPGIADQNPAPRGAALYFIRQFVNEI